MNLRGWTTGLREGLRPSAWLVESRHALRRLARRPGHTAAAVGTLALGIAASVSVLALVYGVVLSPLPYPQSDRVVELDHEGTRLEFAGGLGITYGFFRFYEEQIRSAESMALYSEFGTTLTGAGDPVRLAAARATPSLARVLGIPPVLGRWFTDAEGGPGEPQTVLLSHGLWRDRFGADPGVVGRSVRLDGVPHEILGVMPSSFGFPSNRVALWTPREVPATGIGGWNERAVARLAPGATAASLEDEIRSALPLLREFDDDTGRVRAYLDEAGVVPRVRTLKEAVVGNVRATMWILLGAVAFVFAAAAANVANLFLVRAEEGARDATVRRALGAGRLRIAQGHLAEALLVTGIATATGLGLAALAVGVVRARAPVNLPRLDEVSLNAPVLGTAVIAALMAALLLGLLPSLRARTNEGAGSVRTTAGRAAGRGRHGLVALQVALALVLLVGSGLLLRTFAELRAVELGFSERQALTFRIALPGPAYPDRAAAARFHEELRERLGALPGVRSAAAVAQCLPLSGNLCWGDVLAVDGRDARPDESPIVTGVRAVTPDYFTTMGISVRGRAIQPSDVVDGARGAVLSASAAAAHFPGVDPIGRRVAVGSPEGGWYTVVGVADDVRANIGVEGLTNVIYLPVLEEGSDGPPPHNMAHVIATDLPPGALAGPVRDVVAGLDPSLPVADMAPLDDLIARATAPAAFGLTLVGLAGVMSLLMGAVGVYAVAAFAVGRRTREIGIRIALGARKRNIRTMVFRQNGMGVVVGAAIGLIAAAGLTRLMAGMLYGVRPLDPGTYAVATLVLATVAAFAIWIPARRAASVEPALTLKAE